MTRLNAVGDLVLTEPRAMLALADASRLELHDALHRVGPATAGDLASRLGSEQPEVLRQLEALEDVGLVERSEAKGGHQQPVWSAVGKGIFFEIPEDAEGQSAARALSNTMFLQYVDVPRDWVKDDEPLLTLEWARAAGLLNVRLLVTSDELRDIQSAFEGVLAPYLTRGPDDVPGGASRVRLLSYFMPEPSQRG